MDPASPSAAMKHDPASVAARVYRELDVEAYANLRLRPAERMLFESYRDALSGVVLEVGCGAGRLIRSLVEIASDVHGIDISSEMVRHCRTEYPKGTFEVMDMRDVTAHQAVPFDALIAAFNVLDAVGEKDRHRVLGGFREVLAPGGLLIMSSHNRAVPARGPIRNLLFQLRSGNVRRFASVAVRLRRRIANRHRLRHSQVDADRYAIRNDPAHDYSLLHHYISRDEQERQLSEHGFELLECVDLEGNRLPRGEEDPSLSELYYVARRSA